MSVEKKIGTGEEALGDAITRLSSAVNKLENGAKVNRKAIVILLAQMGNMSQRDVDIVLSNLAVLQRIYGR